MRKRAVLEIMGKKKKENVMNINESQIDNLVNLLDGYAEKGGHHLNVNVFTKDTLLDADRKSVV